MFKNFAVQTRVVRTKKANAETPEGTDIETVDPVEIAQIIAETTIKTVGTIAAIVAANKVLSTVCDISVIVAKAKIK
jgi:topoisomerase IA-like protein